MAFSESTDLPYPVDQVFSVLIDHDFNRSVAESLGGELADYSCTPEAASVKDGAPVTVTMTRTVPTKKLPEMVTKFIKGQLAVQQQDHWSSAGENGARTANLDVKVPAGKVTAEVTQTLEPTDAGTRVTVSGSVKCGIPLVGSKVAQTAEPQVGRVVNRQAREVKKWIESR